MEGESRGRVRPGDIFFPAEESAWIFTHSFMYCFYLLRDIFETSLRNLPHLHTSRNSLKPIDALFTTHDIHTLQGSNKYLHTLFVVAVWVPMKEVGRSHCSTVVTLVPDQKLPRSQVVQDAPGTRMPGVDIPAAGETDSSEKPTGWHPKGKENRIRLIWQGRQT